ncbi:flagellar biosynthesis anti-sigma factor FlgM [Amphibiibacter pelophylacis]|uniref:Flagellar biosynthesis anti-sigma factor FlgM n=1 Tax=Amphibiibacter pelophylacis TaxID=1799477 RepID=A0ACC6P0W3_9BURK
MKVQPLSPRTLTPATGAEARVSNAGQSVEASTRVNISQSATLMDKSSTDGVVNMDKVREIAQAIRDGQFKVNPEAIADKLLASTSEMLSAPQSPH